MSEQAVVERPEDAPIEKKARISKRLREVIHLLASGECKTIKAAAARTNMHPNYLYGAIKKPEVRVFMERETRQTVALGMMRAGNRLVELVDAGSEHVSLDASKHMLAIAGIKPAADAQVSVNIDLKAGFVIDLSEQQHKTIDGNALSQSVTPRTE